MSLTRRWQEVPAILTEPITLAVAKAHLRVDITDDDALILSLIIAARRYLERRTGYWMVARSAIMECNGFPIRGGDIVFPVRPVNSVQSVSYLPDGATALVTLASSAYRLVNTGTLVHRLRLPYGTTEWQTTGFAEDAVRVAFTAGDNRVEENMVQAALLLVGHWYENREAAVVGTISGPVAFTIDALAGMSAVGDLAL